MKKFLFLILLIVCISELYSQEAQSYSKVIQIPNTHADTLYLLSRQWFVSSFKTPNKVIQDDSKELKLISGKGSVEYSYGKLQYLAYEGHLTFLVQIQSRDGRIKVDLTNIIHENLPRNSRSCNLGFITNESEQFKTGINRSYHNNVAKDIKEKMNLFSEKIFQEIEQYLLKRQLREENEW
ncbi:MAG: DUF4468 domain-containing protein [Eubacteriales bacterium]|nr:DUF4468 domain-containing protein [Eubacteriales bacterium]